MLKVSNLVKFVIMGGGGVELRQQENVREQLPICDVATDYALL